MRAHEKDGQDYYFISEQEFRDKIDAGEFAEWEMVYPGRYYGTYKSELIRTWKNHQTPILDIDVKGAIHVMSQYPGQCLSLFIQPPSIEELERRLVGRGTETPESLKMRLDKAEYELAFRNHFDQVVVNDRLEIACAETTALVQDFLSS